MLDKKRTYKRKILNLIQSFLVIIGTALLLSIAAFFIYGIGAVIVALLIWFLLIFLIPIINPKAVLSAYKSYELTHNQVPSLYEMVYDLSKNAGLENPPKLYYLKSNTTLAFSTGTKDNSIIAIADGLFRLLSKEEIYGVLAHEISHIKNNDIWLMQITDTASKVATVFSYAGQVLLLLLFPFIDPTNLNYWIALFTLVAIPPLTIMMQLSLSRIREHGADIDASILTGNPNFLKRALLKLDYIENGIMNTVFNPFSKSSEPSLLRTHPPTKDRIKRLNELTHTEYSIEELFNRSSTFIDDTPIINTRPKRRYFYWYY